MNEIKEIMNGNIKIFNMRIEGETIGFDTPYNSNWNFMPRDFEQIIDTLQQKNERLKEQVQDLKADYGTIAQIERDLYKEVIEEVRKYTKKEIREYKYAIDETTMDSNTEDIYDMAIRNFEKLLQILDKVKD